MWHLRPLANLEQIEMRHDAVEVLASALNKDAGEAITKAMKRIKNTPIHLRRLRRGRGGYNEWKALVDVGHLISTSLND